MEQLEYMGLQIHFSVLGILIHCPENKPIIFDSSVSRNLDGAQVLSSVNECYGGVAYKLPVDDNNDSDLNSDVDLLFYEKSSSTVAGDIEKLSAWYVNLQGGQRKAVQCDVVHNEYDFIRFKKWTDEYHTALCCDLTTRDGIRTFAQIMKLPLRNDNIVGLPIYELYDKVLHQYQNNYEWRASPIKENVQIFTSMYANLCSRVDMVHDEKYSIGSLDKSNFQHFNLLRGNGMEKNVCQAYKEMLTSSKSKMKQNVMVNCYIAKGEITMREAIECCRIYSLRNLQELEKKLVKVTYSIEELERSIITLFEWLTIHHNEHEIQHSGGSIEVWTKEEVPHFFMEYCNLARPWNRFLGNPTLSSMMKFAVVVQQDMGMHPPLYPTIRNMIQDKCLAPNKKKKLDPMEINHFLTLPLVAKPVFEAWFGYEWGDHSREWKHIVQFLLHYHSTTLPVITKVQENESSPSTNIYDVSRTNIYIPDNYHLTACLAIMHMIDAALALNCETDLMQALTIAEIGGSRVYDRRFYISTLGE